MNKLFSYHKLLGITLLLILFCWGQLTAQTNDPSRYASESVLAKGNWLKIKVDKDGVYKITYEMLKKWGISDPKNVQVHGYGGWVINQDFTHPDFKNQDDLPQVAVWMSKNRTAFGPGDYILFYGKGSIKWTYDAGSRKFIQTQNPYSDDSYYFLTESESGPLLMNEVTPNLTGNNEVTTFDDYFLHEKELYNMLQSGREFQGESFLSRRTQDFSVPLPGIDSDIPATVDVCFLAKPSKANAQLAVSVNGSVLSTASIAYVSDSDKYGAATISNTTFATKTLGESNLINLAYRAGTASDKNMYLDFIRINYSRKLKPYGAVTLFRSRTTAPFVEFKIAGASSNLLVFDVSNGETPEKINGTLSGTTLSVKASNSQIREYAMVDLSKQIPTPTLVGKVRNQNLHALDGKEMVIIVRSTLKPYAEELAQIHRQDSGLESLVIDAEDIYNEFSSGKPDITAYRKFLKMFYDRGDNIKYALLFGGAVYDNKFVGSAWSETVKKTALLSYQSKPSAGSRTLDDTDIFATDDYIGFLNDGEASSDIALDAAKLNLGVGRLPVRSASEAASVLKKIKNYIEDTNKGIWKNNIAFVADDLVAANKDASTPGSESSHYEYSEEYARNINKDYPEFIISKIYQDAYRRVVTPSGGQYPEVNKLIVDKLNSGLLLLNYVGHGSTRSWAHENVLEMNTINKLTNKHLPILITATCDFGRYDGEEMSGGEAFILNPNGGAIASFTTTRVVYGSNNHIINKAILSNMFKKEDNMPMRMGDIMKAAKLSQNTSYKYNKLKFILLGDPALRVAYPGDAHKVEITEVNGLNTDTDTPHIEALSDNVVKGKIADAAGNVFADFQGTLDFVIFDSKQALKPKGNNGTGGFFDNPYSNTYKEYDDFTNLLYSGKVKVENGEFAIPFTTTKDILYLDDFGKMTFYAYSDDMQYQAQGSFSNYIVGGMNEDAKEETNPPVIHQMYLNRNDFSSGDKVNSRPVFFAEVSDDTGINLSSGIGHSMSLIVDGTTSYDLRASFVNGADGQKSGTVSYMIPELADGRHSLTFRVWDLWNNSTTASLDFEVVANYKPVVYDFKILGNPAKNQTRFQFISDVNGSEADVKYQVYTLTGALVWSHDIMNTTDNIYEWDLRGSSGARLTPGMYICKMSVSVNGGAKASKSQKLIIAEQ